MLTSVASRNEAPAVPLLFSISGRITGSGGSGLSGVTLTLSGDQVRTTTSDPNGNYSFPNLPIGGDFTVTPAFPNFTFTPEHLNFNDLSQNLMSADFTGTAVVEGLSINDVFVTEPIAGTANATFTVTLSSPSLQTVTVDYSTANGIATAPSDYGSITTTQLAFTPGQISRTINVTVKSDLLSEALETFFVNLSNASGAPIGRPQGTGRIRQAVLNGNIAFYSRRSEGIWLMNSDGTDQVSFTSGLPSFWSPQGTKLLIEDFIDNGFGEFYSINSNGTGRTRLTNDFAFEFEAGWSPDGTKFTFYSRRDGNDEIYTMNADGTNQTRLTNNTSSDSNPAWSPDGSKIAFASERDGNPEIYIMNSDGTNQTRLTTNTASDAGPAWSPDGSKIAFTSLRDGNLEVYLMNADGSHQKNLSENAAIDFGYGWSPEGNRLLFTSDRDGFRQIYVMNPDGTGQTRLTNDSGFDTEPVWSPDGSRIAFTGSQEGNNEIYVVNVDGSNRQRLTNNLVSDERPSWQPVPYTGPVLSIGDVTLTEGNRGEKVASFPVNLEQASTQTITVQFTTRDATALQGSDYISKSGTLTFSPGETTKTIDVTVIGDFNFEPNETFLVMLSNATNATLGHIFGAGNITDEDVFNDNFAAATPISGPSGNLGGTTIGATLEAQEPPLPFPGTATASVWYKWHATVSGPTVFRVTDNSQFPACNVMSLEIYSDTTLATLTPIGSSNGSAFAGLDAVANVDYYIRVSGSERQFTMLWGNAHRVAGTVRNINGRDIGGTVSGTSASFCTGSFGSFPTPFAIYFPVGESIFAKPSKEIVNPPTQFSSTINFDFTVSTPTFTIEGRFRFLPADTTGITVTKNGTPCSVKPPTLDGTIRFDCGTGANQGDYRIKAVRSGYQFKPLGSACDDDPTAYCILGLLGSTITTFDAAPTIATGNVSKLEGATGSNTSFDFAVILGAPTTQQVTVSVATADDTATTANNDYQAIASTQIVFAPGETTKNVSVTVKGDNTFEPDEKFSVLLSNAVNAVITTSQATGTIQNDDQPPTTTVATPAGQNVSVTLNGVTVTFAGVTGAGTTTISPLDLSAVGQLPTNYQLIGVSNAFDISTTAVVQPPISVCFNVPSASDAIFGGLRILHKENGTLVERTATSDFATKTIYASVSSLSPFVLASTNVPLLQLLFEGTGAAYPNHVVALDSFLLLKDPFPIINNQNLFNPPSDRNTRVLVFVSNLQLAPNETAATIKVDLVGSNNQVVTIDADDFRATQNPNFSQVRFRLPDNLAPGVYTIQIKAHEQVSNSGFLQIGP